MILVKTPLRISFFGGGSDIPSYYESFGGEVLSTTIDQYMYTALCKTSMEGIKVVYNDIEVAKNIDSIKHDRVRECLRYFDINNHVEISSFAEIPTKGTGLGSSSTFTVGLINALCKLKGWDMNRFEVAELASYIEITACKENIGKQDQYAASFGGLNHIEFSKDDTIVTPANIPNFTLHDLNNRLMMFYTGVTRSASEVISKQSDSLEHAGLMFQMVVMAKYGLNYLKNERLDDFGNLLNDAWEMKRRLNDGVSNPQFDQYYEDAIKAGALGGKILGAGGGGFFLFYVPLHKQQEVRQALLPLKEFNFRFENKGSQVVYG
jgi:D-glycero-alpha-D-manno-heptose-7-phosphate kinase